MKPFMESEVYEKTKRKGTLAEEAVRVVSGMNRALASAMAQKAPPPSKQGKADAKTKVERQCPNRNFTSAKNALNHSITERKLWGVDAGKTRKRGQ